MEDQKRVQLAVGLSLVVLVGWTFVSRQAVATPAHPGRKRARRGTCRPARSSTSVSGAPTQAAAAGSPSPVAVPEQRTVVERPGKYRVELTNYGAGITSFSILDPKYFSRDVRRLVLRNGQPVAERQPGRWPDGADGQLPAGDDGAAAGQRPDPAGGRRSRW